MQDLPEPHFDLWAVHTDARRQRAIVVRGTDKGTDFSSIDRPTPEFAASPLFNHPAPIIQALVERLASEPDAAR